jgi:1-deoxy-D-xylulose-5-phosphate synthase
VGAAVDAANRLREEGLEVGVVNARFAKPIDPRIPEWIEAAPWAVTVEENTLVTGFGSAVLEAVNDAGIHAGPIRRLGLPDRFVEHGERGELLADLGLDAAGIAAACRQLSGRAPADTASSHR